MNSESDRPFHLDGAEDRDNSVEQRACCFEIGVATEWVECGRAYRAGPGSDTAAQPGSNPAINNT